MKIKLIESENRAYRVLDNGHELAISIAVLEASV